MAESSNSKSKALKVSAPMVTARTKSDRIVYLYRGDVITDDITDESVDNLRDLGFVTSDDVQPA